ncbi:outer membrane autotransporter protein [Bradyrhizobium sp. USDA 4518]|uniref:Autotransporter domain-containing protein n=1 Tax=Bradyrhizobium brasilense TaxID=1419277 RepID=A0ABY8J7R9_9BRAD|nr:MULTISPECIES: autotransporter domain-containing protein [Bradyrhizobium]MCP1834390.1 outer membrane autotransporter protein [Bradyrhizobium sp. USDA 4545]MCP1919136.1 outer membrane autotransporter protein [Bradyrhizobium sp. USDA 4532]NLS72994.1 autotransporter domain-containing protein [Bradyrhizobium brasilense]WFU61595.1 autotransporter domain-containing protein [Bradyrhizobium brasilense]
MELGEAHHLRIDQAADAGEQAVAWQYAFGDVTPTSALAFQGLGTGFTVAGVPLARNAALVEGGLDLRVTPQASIGIAYVGQLADRVQDHSVKASFSWKF